MGAICQKRPSSLDGCFQGQKSGSNNSSSQNPLTSRKPWKMWGHISCGPTKWIIENTMPYIFISDNRASDPAAGTLKAVHCWSPHVHRWKSSLKALPAPCKQLSRQKNSTNSRAEVRWLNILPAAFGDYNISTLSHPCYTGCKKPCKTYITQLPPNG